MTITAIKPFSKGKNRMAIYLNDEFSFVLYKGELSKYGLIEGIELKDEVYQNIINETLIKRCRSRSMNLLMKQDRTENDIRNKLREGGYPQMVIDDAVEYLKSFHYIDDNRYASEYIRIKSESKSRAQIMMALREKGVSDSIIEQEMAELSYDADIELASKLIAKKCRNIDNIDCIEYEDKMKIFAYLYRKGFSRDIIERAFAKLTTYNYLT